MAVRLTHRWIEAFAEIEQAAERSAGFAGLSNRVAGRAAAAFDRRQAEHNLAVGHGEIGRRGVHIRRHHFNVHPLAIFQDARPANLSS